MEGIEITSHLTEKQEPFSFYLVNINGTALERRMLSKLLALSSEAGKLRALA